jgi:hypothetical protein
VFVHVYIPVRLVCPNKGFIFLICFISVGVVSNGFFILEITSFTPGTKDLRSPIKFSLSEYLLSVRLLGTDTVLILDKILFRNKSALLRLPLPKALLACAPNPNLTFSSAASLAFINEIPFFSANLV